MNSHADKTQENKSQRVAAETAQMQSGGESTFQFVDNRPESIFQRKLQEMANNHSLQQQQQIQKKENNIGLPDNLKSGIENLSGYSMDDVKVHYNSDKPAQLQAHAYAQGTDIHIAYGQEKHLPHEAWHVVQQKQGRVKPTMQMTGAMNVNDDAGLETEADVMGAKALSDNNLQLKSLKENRVILTPNDFANAPVQRYRQADGAMISENDEFAVRGHGTPESKMFVKDPAGVTAIKYITFNAGGGANIDGVDFVEIIPQFRSPQEQRAMEVMHCGVFSRHVTGNTETQESGDAPAGRSLFMKTFSPATRWVNHFAPVIIQDGGDRGTYETAVGLDFMFFGIYGQSIKQSFVFKTEIAGMILELETDTFGRGIQQQIDETHPKTPAYMFDIQRNNEAEKAKARSILHLVETDGADGKGIRDTSDIEPLLAKIEEHRAKRFNLQQELDKERVAREVQESQAAELERAQKAKNLKIGLATSAIVLILIALLAIFL